MWTIISHIVIFNVTICTLSKSHNFSLFTFSNSHTHIKTTWIFDMHHLQLKNQVHKLYSFQTNVHTWKDNKIVMCEEFQIEFWLINTKICIQVLNHWNIKIRRKLYKMWGVWIQISLREISAPNGNMIKLTYVFQDITLLK